MKSLITFLLISSLQIYADQINLQIINLEKKSKFEIGDIFLAQALFWPKDKIKKEQLIGLKGKKIQDNIYVSDINEIKLSENNQDVWVVTGLFVLTNPEIGSAIKLNNQILEA